MGRPKLYDIEALAGKLFDRLAAGPEVLTPCPHGILGLDWREIIDWLDVPRNVVYKVTRNQRLTFGGDEINIPIHQCGTRQIYHLAGQISAGLPWQARRIKNEISQEQVNVAWWRSMVNATTHDRVYQRYAQMILTNHERMLADLQKILADLED